MQSISKLLLPLSVMLLGSPAMAQSVRALLREGNTQYEAKAYSLAIETYKKILTRNPSEPEALANIADCYQSINKMEEAHQAYSTLLKNGDKKPANLLGFAHVLKSMGRYEEAKQYFLEYARTDPGVGNHFAASCDFARFQTSQPSEYRVLEERLNSAAAEFGPVIEGNQLVFASQRTDVQRPQGWDGTAQSVLYAAQFGPDGYLSAPTYLDIRPGLGPVSFSADGRYVAYTSNNFVSGVRQIPSAGGQLRITTAEVTAGGNWVNERLFPFNTKKYTTGYPCLTADGNAMFFASDEGADGFGGYDLYISYRKGNGWMKPINLGAAVNTPGNEIAPFFDGNVLYFSSDWHQGFGGMDIFRADQEGGKWVKVTNAGVPLNSASDDYGFVFDASRNLGFFTSNRKGARGAEDIYRVTRGGVQPNTVAGLSLKVVNALDGSPIAGAEIDLSACNPDFSRSVVTTNAAGVYMLPLNANTSCDITVRKDGFTEENVSLFGATAGGNREVEITLTRKGEAYSGFIFNADTQQPLSGVSVSARNTANGAIARAYSDQRGQVSLALAANASYQVTFSAQGFREINRTVSTYGAVNRNILGSIAMYPADGPVENPAPWNNPDGNLSPPASTSSNASMQGYSVQISAMSKEPDLDAFQEKVAGIGTVYKVYAGGMYKVRIGPYPTRAQAEQAKTRIRTIYSGAYIVEESAGTTVAVPIKPVIQLPQQGAIMIQLGAYRNPQYFNPGAVAGLGPILDMQRNEVTLKLLSGFRTVQEAQNTLSRVKASGFPDAFLVEVVDGKVNRLR